MKRIQADERKCMGCRACEFACALAHAESDDIVQAIYHEGARPRVYIESAGGMAVPLQCRHCDDSPCATVCPSGALRRPEPSEPVEVDQRKCIGCAYCVEACPFGVIAVARCSTPDRPETASVVIKCDLCAQRLAEGLEPACVDACPVGALVFEEVATGARSARAKAAARAVEARMAESRSEAER